VPDARRRVRHPIPDKPDAIDSRRRLDLINSRLRVAGRCPPGVDRRLGPHRGKTGPGKSETGRAGDGKPPIRDVVLHVRVIDALARILAAPEEFVRSHILTFGKISRPGVLRRVEIADCDQATMSWTRVGVAGVVIGIRSRIASRINTRKGIDPRPRTNPGLIGIQAG
jgi:hypothetical protein